MPPCRRRRTRNSPRAARSHLRAGFLDKDEWVGDRTLARAPHRRGESRRLIAARRGRPRREVRDSLTVMDIATDDPLLEGLNPAQREAVLHVDGPLLVLAGAGSGKTRVLTTRIARLIDQHGVDPGRILSVTFTNKAAGEMKERIARLLGRAPAGMWVGTFHAIGARMLRAAPHLVGRTAAFTIYDQDDTQSVIKRIMERLQINTKQFTPRGVHAAISDAKNALVYPAEYANLAMDPFSRAVSVVYRDLGEE